MEERPVRPLQEQEAPPGTGTWSANYITVDHEGISRVRDRFVVSAPVAGYARRIDLEVGDKVAAGDVLTMLEPLRATVLERPEQFAQMLTEKLMTFALGRTIEYEDMPTVRAIVRSAAEEDYRFSALVMGIVESDAFQMRAAPEAGPVEEAALHR